ncbi:hypothetical protein BVRB_010650 [Beta vulgaris subsp. vulgaris]|uniref:Uncharacterized protein n=1 Tax=Beta vulgaris subsp. vulgaris TaxID=3555 RepID=A0A0J8B2B5_BETVV|nr:hypothetical protein BVRB_010650 [Beta vulgaris subsp. vulgaris]
MGTYRKRGNLIFQPFSKPQILQGPFSYLFEDPS